MRVWIGCLGCYNGGNLVGEWVEAGNATDFEADFANRVRVPASHIAEAHEEYWVFDIDESPWKLGEMSPSDAESIQELIDELRENALEDAYGHWLEVTGEPVLGGDIDAFRDNYIGHFQTFRDYADEAAIETILVSVDEVVARYFDWESWARDLAYDYHVVDTPQGVYIFHL